MPTYKVIVTEHFKKQLRALVKKNRPLKEALVNTLLAFNKDHEISIGHGVYKLRLAGHSKGKSGGYRLYVFIIESDGILTPLCIYSKNEKENLNKAELSYHLDKVKFEASLL